MPENTEAHEANQFNFGIFQFQQQHQQKGDVPSSPSSTASSPTRNASPNEDLIRGALNQQTLEQFSAYAAQQYPQNPEHQQIIIKQLQEEHFKQVCGTTSPKRQPKKCPFSTE